MPIRGEKARKIRALRAGRGVRPPKRFWSKMLKRVKKQYPKVSKKRRATIVGGIWSRYKTSSKIRIVKKYQ
jgi:hypothetical protein